MRVYKAVRDFEGMFMHPFKKGARFFAVKRYREYLLYPEDGFYPMRFCDFKKPKDFLVRVEDLPYDKDYYVKKAEIRRLRKELKEYELKFNKK